ncbi:MAG: AAA family ATPase [Planctomycetia bacterium]|nr:AAA family ATPase [Planctomycetia bacterium]
MATHADAHEIDDGLRSILLSDDNFWPAEPKSIRETGLNSSFIEHLICKYLATTGSSSGRSIAESLCLSFSILGELFDSLRTRQIVVHAGAAPFNDYYYALTDHGRSRATAYLGESGYGGPAPVPLMDYVLSVEAQAITFVAPKYAQLAEAFRDISVEPKLFASLGPAINSGAGMFLYGAPGNGKSTLARRLTVCFGQKIWIPQALLEGGQIIKLYDAAYHHIVEEDDGTLLRCQDHDCRWLQIWRPTVVVGGELTMDDLEIHHNPQSNVSEAPLQMKSNCGCLLLDDFGRQRIAPNELLNRWIVPLECRHDFLTLANGKKIKVPFEQLIIFSTNLEPEDLVDEAFLRRIPYKIEVGDPGVEEFHFLFKLYCATFDCEYRKDVVNYLIDTHYRSQNRAMRRCHPRDLLMQVRNYCRYNDLEMEIRPEYFDCVVESYFAMVLKGKAKRGN